MTAGCLSGGRDTSHNSAVALVPRPEARHGGLAVLAVVSLHPGAGAYGVRRGGVVLPAVHLDQHGGLWFEPRPGAVSEPGW